MIDAILLLATLVLGCAGIGIGLGMAIWHTVGMIRDTYHEKNSTNGRCEESGCPYPRENHSLWCRRCKKWRHPKRRSTTPLGVEKLPGYLK